MKQLKFWFVFLLMSMSCSAFALFIVALFHGGTLNGVHWTQLANSSQVFLLSFATVVPYFMAKFVTKFSKI